MKDLRPYYRNTISDLIKSCFLHTGYSKSEVQPLLRGVDRLYPRNSHRWRVKRKKSILVAMIEKGKSKK